MHTFSSKNDFILITRIFLGLIFMVKIEPYTKSQIPFRLSKTGEENQEACYITIPLVKDSMQNELLPAFKTVNPVKTQEKPKIKDLYETVVPNIDKVVKETGVSSKSITRMIKMEGIMLKEYQDEAGIKTIGIGHNVSADPNYSSGKEITNEVALDIFTKDLNKAQKSLDKILGNQKLPQNKKEVLLDLVFNMGSEKFRKTELLQLVKQKRFDEAAKGFYIIGAGNQVSPFLCRRRIENIHAFYGENPSIQAVNTMKKIYDKGVIAYDKKIRNAKNSFEKQKYEHKKIIFMNEAEGFMEESSALYNANKKK